MACTSIRAVARTVSALRTLTLYDDNRQDFAGEVTRLVAGVA